MFHTDYLTCNFLQESKNSAKIVNVEDSRCKRCHNLAKCNSIKKLYLIAKQAGQIQNLQPRESSNYFRKPVNCAIFSLLTLHMIFKVIKRKDGKLFCHLMNDVKMIDFVYH